MGKVKLVCGECSKEFKSQSGLDWHVSHAHSRNGGGNAKQVGLESRQPAQDSESGVELAKISQEDWDNAVEWINRLAELRPQMERLLSLMGNHDQIDGLLDHKGPLVGCPTVADLLSLFKAHMECDSDDYSEFTERFESCMAHGCKICRLPVDDDESEGAPGERSQ